MPERRRSMDWPRLAGYGVLAFSVVLPVIELGRLALLIPRDQLLIAIVATVAYLPLHLRHVAHGLRGLRPTGAGWTLAAMAVIMAAASLLVGNWWAMMFASLVVSVLLVLSLRWSIVLTILILVAAFLLGQGPDEMGYAQGGDVPHGTYFVGAVAVRGITLYVVVRLVAATRQLQLARAELSRVAVNRERRRIDHELRWSLNDVVSDLVVRAQRAEQYGRSTDPRHGDALSELITTTRDTLQQVRRIVTGYRKDQPDGPIGVDLAVLGVGSDASVVNAVRWARWLLALVYLSQLIFMMVQGGTGMGLQPFSRPEIAVPAAIAIGFLSLRLAVAATHGRPRYGILTCLGLILLSFGWLAIDPVWMTHLWTNSVPFIGAAIAILVRGPVRVLALIVPAPAVIAVAGIVDPLPVHALGMLLWGGLAYPLAIGVLLTGALYGVVRLNQVVDELYETRYALATESVFNERHRVSRDLHDLLAQSLSAISLKGDLALRLLATRPDAAVAETRGIAELAVAVANDVREVTRDERVVSLRSEATAAVELLEAAQIETTIELPAIALPPEVEALFGWAVREGATNVLRHSAATWCRISVIQGGPDRFELTVLNDGADAPNDHGGHGLAGLTARAQAVSGAVSAGPITGDRFRLRVTAGTSQT